MHKIEFIKKNKIIFILILAGFLIFYNFTSGGMYGDDAIYSTRSIGTIDFMFANNQPTLLQLFDQVPWWSDLSNHDHPPLIFWIQHIFFLLGSSILLAKMHLAVFGIFTIFIVYLIVKKGFGEKIALLSSFLLTINPYFLWFARVAYLEMIVIFFIVLTLYYLIKFLEDHKKWLYFGLSLGALLITKYTSLFIIPAILLYFFIKERNIFKVKELYFAGLVVLAVISPVIIYNIMMYNTLGHFDLEWSGVLGQRSPWDLDRNITQNYGGNLLMIWQILANSSSYLFAILFVISVFLIIINKVIYKFKNHEILVQERMLSLLFYTLFCLILFFTVIVTPETRFLSLFTVFMAIFIGISLGHLINIINKKSLKYLFFSVIFILFGYQLLFTVNSILLNKPIGIENVTYSRDRIKDYGINSLDLYLDNMLDDKNVINKIDFYKELKRKKAGLQKYKLENFYKYSSGESFHQVIVFDPNINWFAGVWLFEKRRLYENLPFLTAQEFISLNKSEQGDLDFYFIKVEDGGPLTPDKYRTDFALKLEKQLIENNIKPDLIYRKDGELAFKIYKK